MWSAEYFSVDHTLVRAGFSEETVVFTGTHENRLR